MSEVVMKALPFTLAVFTLVGCTSISETTRVSTTLRAQEFNSLASRYMEKATFVSMMKMSDGKDNLTVQMETFAVPHVYDNLHLTGAAADSLRHTTITFLKDDVTSYVAAIDKFLEWSALATQRKDAFDKEISKVPTWGNGGARILLEFTFHSGNDQDHFLVITTATPLMTLDDSQIYDVANAKELKRLLLAFASDSIQKTDIDSVYK